MSEFATEQTVAAQSLVARLRTRAKKRPIRAVVEYALVLAFIAVLMIVAVRVTQPQIVNTLNQVTGCINGFNQHSNSCNPEPTVGGYYSNR